jgi:toxin HigB-1
VRVRFADEKLERLEMDAGHAPGLGPDIVNKFRKTMQFLPTALDERDFYSMKSPHYEKLKGKRSHQRSMRLIIQFRLILEIEQVNSTTVVIHGVEKHYE